MAFRSTWPTRSLAAGPAPALPGGPRDAGPLISALRMVKSPLEIERVRRSVGAAVAGDPGRAGGRARGDDREGAGRGHRLHHVHDGGTTAGTKPLFVNCVSGRARYPLVDSPASDNVIADGDIVFVDGGGASDGYVSDILRLIGVGPLRAEDRRYAEVAAEATRAMIAAVRPGVRVSELLGRRG